MAATQIHTHTKRRHDDPDVSEATPTTKRSKSDDGEHEHGHEHEHHHKHHHKKHHDEEHHKHKHHHKRHQHEHGDETETRLSTADSLAHADAALHSQSPSSDKKSLVDTKSLVETTTTQEITKPTLYELLTTNTVKQLLQEKPKKPVVTIEHNATLRTCIERMAENHVLSLPMISGFSVEDAEEGDVGDESGKFMGNLDISTIMHAFIQHMDENGSDPFHVRQFWDRLVITVHSNDADIAGLMKTEENCSLRELIHTCFFTKNANSIPLTQPPVTVPSEVRPDTNALPNPNEAVPVGYVHRVAVFDGKGEVRDIISQTDLIRYLSAHLSSHGSPLLAKTIEELGFANREVYTISNDCTAMQALRMVDEQEWTGVAIVDKKGHLVGSLTTNDLRGMTMSDMDHVLEPICDWLKRVASHLHRESLPLQYVIPDHPIAECIDGMVLDSIHRLYVVRSYHDPTPIGVITLTDLLELLFKYY